MNYSSNNINYQNKSNKNNNNSYNSCNNNNMNNNNNNKTMNNNLPDSSSSAQGDPRPFSTSPGFLGAKILSTENDSFPDCDLT